MKLEFFYDVVSPYSLLAFKTLQRYQREWSLDLVLRPIFLGGLLRAAGNQAPMDLPARAPYVMADIVRCARFHDVELTIPNAFPMGTLGAMRVLSQVEDKSPDKLQALTDHYWTRYWTAGEDLEDEGLRKGLRACDVEEGFADRVRDPEVKAALKTKTEAARARGAFGAPAMFVDDELYFGADRLALLAHDHGLPWRGPTP